MAGPQLRLITQLASVNRVVLDLFKVYQPAFSMKRLATGLDLDPSLPLTWADRPQLELGLGNLLSNAIDNTRRGGMIVCRTELDGKWVKLTIGDDGPGGSAVELEQLVAPWGQGAGEERSGVGLHMSRAIIAAHGGDLALDRSRELGTWFVVRLPAIALEHARLVDQLEQSNRQKRDLVATLSHELRTPLNVIMGYVDLLLEGAFGPFSPDQIDTLRRMDRGGRELLELIDGAIDVGSSESRRLPLELRDLHLPDLIRRFCQLTAEVLGCDFSHIFLWQRTTDVYLPVAGYGDAPEQWEWVRMLRIPAIQVMRLLAGREREDAALFVEAREWMSAGAAAQGFGRCLIVPLQRDGEILGIMTAGDRGGARTFGADQPRGASADKARVAQGIADLAALAVDNARIVDELERVRRLKAEFVITMSHQFRIPLNVVIGYNDLLLDGEFGAVSSEQTTALRRIRKSGLELLTALNQILDLENVSR